MNRITTLFETKKNGILSVYFTAGYPEPDNMQVVLEALQSHGVDMVEIGIPFSDPMQWHVAPHVVRSIERCQANHSDATDTDGLPKSGDAVRFRGLLPVMCGNRH